MRRAALVLAALALVGCFRSDPPKQTITPGSRIIYNGGVAIWAVCDRGNLIYMTEGTAAVHVVANGCPTGTP